MQLAAKRWTALLLAWLTCSLPRAAPADSLSREELENRLATVKTEIQQLQQQLSAARQRFKQEQLELRSVDLEIQAAALELRSMQATIAERQGELTQLKQERTAYLKTLSERQDQLSQQVVAAYRLGRASRLRLLLNQDDPGRLGRTMAYYEYFSKAYADQIRDLRDVVDRLKRMQEDIDQALNRLREAEKLGRAALAEMQTGRSDRQALLAAMATGMENDAVRLQELARDRADLEALLERLAKALADIPSDLGQYQHPRRLRGDLPMPLAGRVLHAFGQDRVGGMHWQGWLIEAESGTEVRAIAYGRVVYADWLRGYGMLMVIDHGEGFMSLYGNNESLLFEPGDWVQPGTSIATVGSDPGSGQGLYFELRSQGEAIDPAAWIKRG